MSQAVKLRPVCGELLISVENQQFALKSLLLVVPLVLLTVRLTSAQVSSTPTPFFPLLGLVLLIAMLRCQVGAIASKGGHRAAVKNVICADNESCSICGGSGPLLKTAVPQSLFPSASVDRLIEYCRACNPCRKSVTTLASMEGH
jgi:hypothetical protein